MTGLKIKDSYDIRTPWCHTFTLKLTTVVMNPYGLSESFRNFLLYLTGHDIEYYIDPG